MDNQISKTKPNQIVSVFLPKKKSDQKIIIRGPASNTPKQQNNQSGGENLP